MANPSSLIISRRALQIAQSVQRPLYLFTLTAAEILQVAEISRVNRDGAGDLIGYQRAPVRAHIQEIVEYLDGDNVLFPNPIILALSSDVHFTGSRGPKTNDGVATAGTIDIPLVPPDRPKPGWIVDGQQRALALAQAGNKNFPVPVTAFIADEVSVQRDQFIRVNNTKPLPRSLVTELLPEVTTELPRRLTLKQLASQLCNMLNQDEKSPFHGLISRSSTDTKARKTTVITDTSIIKMLEESLKDTGCLFQYRNMSSGNTDVDGVWRALMVFWTAVKDTFPDAWGKPSTKSRLSHGAGIRAMGRLMDRVLVAVDPLRDDAPELVRRELAKIAPECRWTSGTWEELGMKWNAIENLPKHIQELSNFLIRTYVTSGRTPTS
ncbi:DGQHR domain-containing protein DpdB [Lentzea sp. NPDC058436]|uniref:DGQHR domain-containing protein DpdB n=1 Tax=Lentzea sp. NPDC058436 TaxID=3346499 RepID=UPI003661B96E